MSQLTTSELLKSGKTLVSITQPLVPTHPFIDRQTVGINDAITNLTNVDNEVRAHEETEEIRRLDGSVDMLIPLIEDDLRGSVKKAAFARAASESAEIILNLFAKRDRQKLIYGSYADQGREADALFAELFSPEYTEHLEKSNIKDMADALLRDYTELQKLLKQRLNEGNYTTTQKEEKTKLRYRMDKLLSHIDANILDNVDGFAAIETPVNEMVTEIMSDYKKRVTRKANLAQGN